ncbi:flavin monoamine oxidase family protein [Peribacillus sp. SCS-37]|uniref:flavin monoamine oxidase family protein n=1 Tax=Paraperibacillus esterisolvens TaxID=3115296 RepID=UPI0039066845
MSVHGFVNHPYLHYIDKGLGKTDKPKKIAIIGAGMSGLAAGSLLREAGHDITILEGSDRAGGRIYTIRKPFTDPLYFEAGAMRIPGVHSLTLAYLRKYKLKVNRFYNSTPEDLIYVNGRRIRLKYLKAIGTDLNFPVAGWEKKKTALELFQIATRNLTSMIMKNPDENWKYAQKLYGDYSMDLFLRKNPIGPSLSSGAIDMIKVMLSLEGFPELSFFGIYRELLYLFDPFMKFYEVEGGNDRLPLLLLDELKEDVQLRKRVSRIRGEGGKSISLDAFDTKTHEPVTVKADCILITIPFSAFQYIDVVPQSLFSYHKWRAIRELHYVTSTKIGIQFKKNFWSRNGYSGGQSITDLPIRFSYYPSRPGKGANVMTASYTWEDDTLLWDSMPQEDCVQKALENLAKLHGSIVFREFEAGVSYSWSRNPFSSGAFSLAKPAQEQELGPFIASPEGRVHFAGEHTSNFPAWIEGAVESGIRAAIEIHLRSAER